MPGWVELDCRPAIVLIPLVEFFVSATAGTDAAGTTAATAEDEAAPEPLAKRSSSAATAGLT
jgi:hypothetical protein